MELLPSIIAFAAFASSLLWLTWVLLADRDDHKQRQRERDGRHEWVDLE